MKSAISTRENPEIQNNRILNNIKNIDLASLNLLEEIPIKEALTKICVSPPYFAFNKIYRLGNILISPIIPEQIFGQEESSITIGESGRHLAILGTCAASLHEDKKFYYLVENAILHNQTLEFNKNHKKLFMISESTERDRRKVSVSAIVVDQEKNILFNMDASFNKISPDLFGKFFKKNYRETKNYTYNPYNQYLNLEELSCSNTNIQFSLPPSKDEICVGHFKNYPAIPTAFFVYNIMHFCSNKFLQLEGKTSFIVTTAELNLFELIFPDSEKIVEATYKKVNIDEVNFECTILQNEKVNSKISFSIKFR